jgi:ribosomal protein S18 acetylase RimI-like enzyme
MTGTAAAGYDVVPLRASHCTAVARLHAISVDGFLSTLGPPALRHFYRAYLDYPRACALIARRTADGVVVGFVVGTEDLRRHYRMFVLKRLLPMVPALVARALTEPCIVLGLLGRARQVAGILGRGPSQSGSRPYALPSAHLMMMAVHPRFRSRGVGEALVRSFTDEMARRGVPRLILGVRDQNHTARRLYERLGWQPALRERAHDGSVSWLYVRDTEAESVHAASTPRP